MRLLSKKSVPCRQTIIENRHEDLASSQRTAITETVDRIRRQNGPVAAILTVRSLHSSPILDFVTRGRLAAEAEGVQGLGEEIALLALGALDALDPARYAVVVVFDDWMVRNRVTTVFAFDLASWEIGEVAWLPELPVRETVFA